MFAQLLIILLVFLFSSLLFSLFTHLIVFEFVAFLSHFGFLFWETSRLSVCLF